ncbi:MAG: pre-16S rRNA-processing nuclease YqgF [Coleofasciculus sp. G1-WW12-02]|uniref:pre-16S rRNA-processing nuclease YqgF n=1 Tax=Coleofasciculus sp. G1-WW12-02 TaxID=3068483 RepID=UPI0032FE6AF9
MILGFDPGRDKCGLAVKGKDQHLSYHQVVPSEQAIATLKQLCQQFTIETIVMGNQTTSKQWQGKIREVISATVPIVLVDERYSTLEARDRYWQMYPPKGLQRLVPQGMRQPPRPIDDIVAILLIERYVCKL